MADGKQSCGICEGALVLRHPGTAGELSPDAFSPTCHRTGVHADLFACSACGTVQQPALPEGDELVGLYRAMRDDEYLAEEAGRRATARRLLERIERHGPTGRLLEVGASHGLLLDEARSRGWAVTGLEPSTDAREHAAALGLDVRDALLEDLDPATDGGYDAIAMVDVLEHLDDPVAALRRCRSLLADGGVLCVVTPDPSSATARIAGHRWWALLPAHTYLLPRRTLRRVLADQGLEPVADVGLRRTFTLGYWASGLGERSGPLAGIAARAQRGGLARRPVTLSLGDERVMIARRGAAVTQVVAGTAPAARRQTARTVG